MERACGVSTAPIPTTSDETAAPYPATILVVQDDATLRGLMQRALGDAGYTVPAAAGATEAKRKLKEAPVDLVVTDVYLRDGDGVDLMMHLRETAPQLPVIAIASDYRGPGDAVLRAVRHLGARRILEKPFSLQVLLDAVRDSIRPAA